MSTPHQPHPDAILAHVNLMRLTNRLLTVADELRQARDNLHAVYNQATPQAAPPPPPPGKGKEAGNGTA